MCKIFLIIAQVLCYNVLCYVTLVSIFQKKEKVNISSSIKATIITDKARKHMVPHSHQNKTLFQTHCRVKKSVSQIIGQH